MILPDRMWAPLSRCGLAEIACEARQNGWGEDPGWRGAFARRVCLLCDFGILASGWAVAWVVVADPSL
jgi:hypothetical protein